MRGRRLRRRSTPSSPPASRDVAPARPLRALLVPFLRNYRAKLAVVAIAAFAGGLVEAAILVLVARIALAIASDDSRFLVGLGPLGTAEVTVTEMLAVASGLVLVRLATQLAQVRLTARTLTEIGRATRRKLVRLYLGASWPLQAGERQGRLQELVSSVAVAASSAGSWAVGSVVAGLSFVALILTAFAVNAVASVVMTGIALLLAGVFHPLRRAVRRLARRSVDANLELAGSVAEVSSLAQEIRVFEAEAHVSEMVGSQIDEAARRLYRQRALGEVIPSVYQGAALALVVAALAAVYAASFSRLSALSAVVLIMLRSLSYGQALQRSLQGIHESVPNLEILASEVERLEAAQIPLGGEPVGSIGTLRFERVSFSYDGERHALQDLSFETRPGEIVGIVGPSGAGKSTLMQLILRLRDPTEGRILSAGRDVSGLALADWYHHVGFVPQDPRLFAGSVADNIRFYRSSVSDEQLVTAARLANLHDEVLARPGGYDSSVGERGHELSGGQRQRLCIARALVEHPDVLVLDEPTSALDVHSEVLIRDALGTISRETTVFIIAHRLSTLAICHRIMVLQAGSLVGFDTPEQLEQTTPFYREALQLAGLK